MLNIDCSALPPYTPSSVVPSYSSAPGSDEVVVAHNPRSKSRVFTGTLKKQSGRDTLVLANQDASAAVPTYGRNAVIAGFVSVEDREKVSQVVLQVRGKIEAKLADRGSNSKTIIDDAYTLWSAQDSDAACPSNVPFAAILPSNFRDGTATHALPPTYNVTSIAYGGVSVKVEYSLSVVVTRTRGRKLAFIFAKNTTTMPFNYCPRARPGRPIQPPVSDFLADVKLMPEEWRQTTTTGKPHPKSALEAVDIHLFIPAAEVFALRDTIPLHVQLTGSVPSLRQFLPDPDLAPASPQPIVQVLLLRQLLVTVNGCPEPCRLTLGTTALSSTPPGATAAAGPATTAGLDWAGELRCMAGVDVGSFDAGVVKVQDFIVVDIIPPAEATAQFPRLRHSHPVRLVTDSWPDE
ncbi:hypothetical protein B0H11DRAFT_1815317 [Mycena galericulata]|nr:hypothetical protein B0H11DRAFT_1815317 [Mycena galericulata]